MDEHAKDADRLPDLPQPAADEKTDAVKGGAILAVNGGGNTPNGEARIVDGTSNTLMISEKYD